MIRSVMKGGLAGLLVAVLGAGVMSLIFPAPKEPGAEIKLAGSPTPEEPANVDLPAGSDFSRPATDRTPSMPTPDGAPISAPTKTPRVSEPQPSLAPPSADEIQSAARPEMATEMAEPRPESDGETVALAEPVAPEAGAQPDSTQPAAMQGAPAPDTAPEIAATRTPAPDAQPEQTAETAPAAEMPALPDVTLQPPKAPEQATPPADEGETTLAANEMPALPEAGMTPPEAEPQAAPSLGDMPAPDQLPPEGEGIDTAQADKPEISNDPATSPDLPAGRALPQAGDAAPIKPRIFSLQDAPSLPGKPVGGFKSAPGVVVDRLPQVTPSTAPTPEEGPDAQSAQDMPEVAAVDAADLNPIRKFAAPAPISDKPQISLVLIDPGVAAGGLDPATITASDLPMTIAIDPTREGAADDAKAFRAAGFEVAILAAGLPANAAPEDVEVALEAWRHVIPEAVAVVEPPQPQFQNNRPLARQMISALSRGGLGVVTQKKGFDSANQIATSADLPRAQVWRVIDDGREKAAVISRMLARADFEAERNGSVVVMLSAWPESVQGIEDWYIDAQNQVTLTPVSALALDSVAAGAPDTEPKMENAGQ
ncbi:divergent polysaccharide deacetylase family protein [Thioclava sp. F28-4]|uniref:divergent polysaccharide deacetylase family protein n=1 Tax=Thioclava sp. F28-4 TaxID=1915315 RepID=UPI0009987936|nr:divergent polysaccharide deacetylase family protein [Thioclava sp. F28-4]OOY05447.1 hypothetical protein BMI87_05190 [Thioclava sp. F28-4]